MHGKVSRITHRGGPLFAGIPRPFEATRYHSLIVREPLPRRPAGTSARSAEGEVMALRHRDAPTYRRAVPSRVDPDAARQAAVAELSRCVRRGRLCREREATVGEPGPATPARGHRAGAVRATTSPSEEAEAVMMRIMTGEATPAQIGAYLAALRAKGETVAEIIGFARAMRQHATPVRPTRRPLVDTCGTGGDRAHTFNISTTAALVVAGAGVAVAKHGNRSVSSRCGSADVLQALGVKLDLTAGARGALHRRGGLRLSLRARCCIRR